MSLISSLAPQLPYVRRYSRALTGDQRTGDRYVRATLEALVAGEQFLDGQIDARVALYKTFHVLWNSTGEKLAEQTLDAQDAELGLAERQIRRISPKSRQAFLLTTVEGFTPSETSQILGDDIASVRRLVARAQAEIDEQLSTDVVIIEDEPIIAADIAATVEDMGHCVLFIAGTRSEAAAYMKGPTPGLVLADVQLADGSSGIDAANDILRGHVVPVIFVTAFPERLLTGHGLEPTFLVTKPFQPENLKAAIGQALFFHPHQTRPGSRSSPDAVAG